MATLNIYTCPKCGYTIEANPRGYDAYMSGMLYDFRCDKCKEIVFLMGEDMSKDYPFLRCPKCKSDKSLHTWNPVDGCCPKCNHKLVKESNVVVMAD